jgi:hypothetical protein
VRGLLTDYGLAPVNQPARPERHRLVDLALGLDAWDGLGEAVHELAQEVALGTLNTLENGADQEEHLAARERVASAINNGGAESQVAFLLEHFSPEEVERIIRQAAA